MLVMTKFHTNVKYDKMMKIYLCFLTLSESAPSSLLSDFQPVLPLGPFSLQTGAIAAASFPQVATICCVTLPALPSRRWTLNAHR